MPSFLATLRLAFKAEDEVEAQVIAEVCREHAEEDLEPDEDGDEAIITQVMSLDDVPVPEELIDRLVRTRNDLIRTRYIDCWNLARELDRIIHALRQKLDPNNGYAMANYDYSHFLEVTTSIINRGEAPND